MGDREGPAPIKRSETLRAVDELANATAHEINNSRYRGSVMRTSAVVRAPRLAPLPGSLMVTENDLTGWPNCALPA